MDDDRSARQILGFLKTKTSAFWERERTRRPLQLFRRAAREVPAYKDFLRKNRVPPEKIRTWADFGHVPPVTKENYLRAYPMEKLMWGGTVRKPLVFTATSGSTGKPFYFPRGRELDWQSSVMHEAFLKNGLRDEKGPTLVIIGFGMGIWIGGLITYKAFEMAALRGGYEISIITPGINKVEIFNALRDLAPHFSQVILAGYPPFLKDIIDEAPQQGINLKKIPLRLLSAAEAYTERFRDYLARSGGVENIYLDTMNVYGSADIGTMAHETPASILLRRLAVRNQELFCVLFSKIMKTPTLAQYDPYFITFEAQGNDLVLTGDNAMPLVRYALGDHGGVLSFEEAIHMLEAYGIKFGAEARAAGIHNYVSELPLVYVYERSDFSVKLHLHDVCPEIIRDVLTTPKMSGVLTGKFTMATRYNEKQDQYLELNLELRKRKKASKDFTDALRAAVLNALRLRAVGPGNPRDLVKRPNLVKLVFWPAEHPLYFRPGVKQAWVECKRAA